jgi:hypothetical protein
MALTREQILAADDLPREKVMTPEWGTDLPLEERFVWVRTLSAGQRERWEAMMEGPNGFRGRGQLLAAMVALTACDEDGRLLFTPEDIPGLADKSSHTVMLISNVATRLAKIEAADIEELSKNSNASPSAFSASN